MVTALAASRIAAGRPAVVVNVGTAVTCDLVDGSGTFRGGAIFPGPQLMARSLHEHTAQLPLVDASDLSHRHGPGTDTRPAIELGIRSAVGGGIERLVWLYADALDVPPLVFLTGGGAGLFADGEPLTPEPGDTRLVPSLTLEGIRIAAEAMP